MPEGPTWRRVVLGLGVFGLLVMVWPAVSSYWTTALGAQAASLADGVALSPSTASPTLPVVAGVIASLSLSVRTRMALVAGAFATTLGAEAALVLWGAASGASAGTLNIGSGLVQDAVPALWMLAALTRVRVASRVRGRAV